MYTPFFFFVATSPLQRQGLFLFCPRIPKLLRDILQLSFSKPSRSTIFHSARGTHPFSSLSLPFHPSASGTFFFTVPHVFLWNSWNVISQLFLLIVKINPLSPLCSFPSSCFIDYYLSSLPQSFFLLVCGIGIVVRVYARTKKNVLSPTISNTIFVYSYIIFICLNAEKFSWLKLNRILRQT